MSRRRAGFTLIELMVAVAVVGLLLVGIGAFLNGTMRFSSTSIGVADRMRELNDVSGYVVDNIRRAESVDVGTCSALGSTYECVVLVVPEERGGSTEINAYVDYAYVRVPRADFVALQPNTVPQDPWLDANADVLLEYRMDACTGAGCSHGAAAAGDLSPFGGPYLVLDGLAHDLASVFASSGSTVSLTLQAIGRRARTPAGAPLTLNTVLRNE